MHHTSKSWPTTVASDLHQEHVEHGELTIELGRRFASELLGLLNLTDPDTVRIGIVKDGTHPVCSAIGSTNPHSLDQAFTWQYSELRQPSP